MSTATTLAPRAAKRFALAKPMPEAAPVTTATLPSIDCAVSLMTLPALSGPERRKAEADAGPTRRASTLTGSVTGRQSPAEETREAHPCVVPHRAALGAHLRDRAGGDVLGRLPLLRATLADPRLPHRVGDGDVPLGRARRSRRRPGLARPGQRLVLLGQSRRDPLDLARRPVVVRRAALRYPHRDVPHPPAVPRAQDDHGPRHRGARA